MKKKLIKKKVITRKMKFIAIDKLIVINIKLDNLILYGL